MSIKDRESVYALITFTGTFTLSNLASLALCKCTYVTKGKTEGKRYARIGKLELEDGKTNGSHDETAMAVLVIIMDLLFV